MTTLAVRHGVELNAAYEVIPFRCTWNLRDVAWDTLNDAAGDLDEIVRGQVILCEGGQPSINRTIALGTSVRRAPSFATRKVAALLTKIGMELVDSGVWGDIEAKVAADTHQVPV